MPRLKHGRVAIASNYQGSGKFDKYWIDLFLKETLFWNKAVTVYVLLRYLGTFRNQDCRLITIENEHRFIQMLFIHAQFAWIVLLLLSVAKYLHTDCKKLYNCTSLVGVSWGIPDRSELVPSDGGTGSLKLVELWGITKDVVFYGFFKKTAGFLLF